MPDNRNYAVGMKNEGGAPVYMEDLKLSERSAVPNAASIANLKFLLTTGDDEGFRTAIKSYIDEAIRSALGALVDNLDKGTGVSRILGTDSSHDLGTITPANLASVLGVNALGGNPAVIKGGVIPGNTTIVLNMVTGGLLFIGVFSGCSIYFCEYWSTNCVKITGVADFDISKIETSANVTVNNSSEYGIQWLYIGLT